MRKKIVFLMVMFSVILNAGQFDKLVEMEKGFFGFSIEGNRSFEARLSIMEKELIGRISERNVIERQEQVFSYLYVDGARYSLATRVGNIEEYLFDKRKSGKDLLTRVEEIEGYLFKKIFNSVAVSDRIRDIYTYLLLKDTDFFRKGSAFITKIGRLYLKPVWNYNEVKKGDTVDFIIENDIEGFAVKGDIISGEVTEKNGFTVLNLKTLKRGDKIELDLFKELKISGDFKQLMSKDSMIVDDIIKIN